jgi:hypothetical protein
MIDYRLKYQAVLFLNASDIQANSKNISLLMNEFADKELIPNTFQELTNLIPLIPQHELVPQNRFQLTSPNNEWIIRFGTFRIDFEKNPTNLKGSNLGGLKEFCVEAKSAFERILNKYPRKGNRISLVSRFLLEEFPEEKMQMIYTKLFNSPELYKENKPVEWNWRTVSRLPKKIDGLNEEFNFITQINRVQAEFRNQKSVNTIDRIELNLDINSSPLNTDNRLGISEIGQFYDSVQIWHDDLIDELIDFLK